MKYIKIYEIYTSFDNPKLNDIKKLLSHLIKFFNELNYSESNYMNNGKYETEFSKDEDYLYIELDSRQYTLEIKSSSRNINNISIFLPKYFKGIIGLKFISEIDNFLKFKLQGNINNVIKQINKEDFEFKMNTNKYNL